MTRVTLMKKKTVISIIALIISFIGVIVAIFQLSPKTSEQYDIDKTETYGHKSPIIKNTDGSVNINYSSD